MIVDLHNHAEGSRNTSLTLADYTRQAAGRDVAVGITEHNRLCTLEGRAAGVLVLPGIEILNDYGDYLVFGASEACVQQRDIFCLIDAVHNEGGIIIAAHPYAGYGLCRAVETRVAYEIIARLDAIEVLNGRASSEACRQAERLSREHHKPGTGGSDAHHAHQLFTMGTRFGMPVAGVADLVRAVRAGACEPVRLDLKD